jgi:phosphoribosylformylglycinamidine synthase
LFIVFVFVHAFIGDLNDRVDDFGSFFPGGKFQIIRHSFSLTVGCFWEIGGPPTYNSVTMKAHVYVMLRKTVLDPQGQTIHGALRKMQYRGVEDVRQGKYFLLTLDDALALPEAQLEVERIAREVLVNPVIEEYTYRLEP